MRALDVATRHGGLPGRRDLVFLVEKNRATGELMPDGIGESSRRHIVADGIGKFTNPLLTPTCVISHPFGTSTPTAGTGQILLTAGTLWSFTITWDDGVVSTYEFGNQIGQHDAVLANGVVVDTSGHGRYLKMYGFADYSAACASGKLYGSDRPNLGRITTPVHLLGDSFLNNYGVLYGLVGFVGTEYTEYTQHGAGGTTLAQQSVMYSEGNPLWKNSTLVICDFGVSEESATSIASIESIIAQMPHERWIYMQPAPDQALGTSGRDTWDARVSEVAAWCGGHYVSTLDEALLAGNGSAEDTTEIEKGLWPLSLKTSTSDYHPSELGKQFIAGLIRAALLARGWLTASAPQPAYNPQLTNQIGPAISFISTDYSLQLLYTDGSVYIGPSFTFDADNSVNFIRPIVGETQVSTAGTSGGNGFSVAFNEDLLKCYQGTPNGNNRYSGQVLTSMLSGTVTVVSTGVFDITGIHHASGGRLTPDKIGIIFPPSTTLTSPARLRIRVSNLSGVNAELNCYNGTASTLLRTKSIPTNGDYILDCPTGTGFVYFGVQGSMRVEILSFEKFNPGPSTTVFSLHTGVASSAITSPVNIVSFNDTVLGGIYFDAGGTIKAKDGTNVASVAVDGGWQAEELMAVCLSISGTTMKIGYARHSDAAFAFGTAVTFAGSMNPLDTLRFGMSASAAFGIKRVAVWDRVLAQTDELRAKRYFD